MQDAVTVQCPGCGTRGRVSPRRELTEPVRVRCRGCGHLFLFRPGGGPGADAAAGPALAPGRVLAQRFRILAALGRGGMGEVYEAEDLELGGRVALKTVRPDIARQGDALDRFRREIQLARRVTHSNVCRIFDVFRHGEPDGGGATGGAPLLFLTMELLRGETLARRLAREGRLTPAEVLPIARQLAAALDAAHAAGVVHRDFKSANVMLVPAPAGGVRAVVTDFGLARPTPGGDLTAALTLGKETLGTPDYMAPEQVEGGEITAAVDVYAFGVTLYEAVTGRRPFTSGSALTTAVKRLTEPPPPPGSVVPDLDPHWERTILGCMARDPETRFRSAGEAVSRLEAEGAGAPPEAHDARRADPAEPTTPLSSPRATRRDRPGRASGGAGRRAHRLKVAALLAVIAASAAVTYYRVSRWEPPDSPVHQVLGVSSTELVMRPSVAVVGLRDLSASPDLVWLSTALAEMLRTELRTAEGLRVVGDERMARLDPELATTGAEGTSPDALERLRRALGADYLVTGTYAALGGAPERRVRLDLHLHDAVLGRRVATVRESGPEAELFDLVARAGLALHRRLDVERDAVERQDRPAVLPTTPEAARLYAEGLARLNRFEPLAARDLLVRAAEIEPTSPLVHSALSQAWASLGYAERARREARRALELGNELPREERLALEARLLELEGDWPAAARAYRALWALYPDDAEYGVRLVGARVRAGRGNEALTAVAALRTLPPPAGEDPRIDLAEARAARALGDLERAREAASRAAQSAAAQEIVPLVAQARLAECEALRQLGRLEGAAAACREAEGLSAERGDGLSQAAALTGLAGVLHDRGELEEARELLERALELNRTTGDQGAAAAVLNNLAVVLRNQGDPTRARELYEEALSIARETGNARGEAYTLGNLASLLIQEGRLDHAGELAGEGLELLRELGDRSGEAAALERLGVVAHLSGRLPRGRELQEQGLAIRREIGHRRGEAGSLKNLGRLALDAGELAEAERLFGEALTLSRATGHRDLEAAALFGLGQVLFERGDPQGAAGRLDEALAVRSDLGQRGATAETRTALARLALERGEPAEAAALARLADRECRRQGLDDDRAWALALLARALAAIGDSAEALETADRAEALAGTTENRRVQGAVVVEVARARRLAGAATGSPPEGAAGLAELARDGGGFPALALEARLARIEMAGSTPDPPPEEAQDLAAAAEEAGFLRIARACARHAG